MKKSNTMISDWLDQHGDPEIEKQVEEEIKRINKMTNMTVYIVSPVDYYWYEPVAVFKSEKEAEAYIKDNSSANSNYDEYQITELKLEIVIKRLIEKLKALRLYFAMGSPSNKHDCRESKEIIEKLPLLEGDSYMSPPKYYAGDTYNVKCKICGNSWWQNHP